MSDLLWFLVILYTGNFGNLGEALTLSGISKLGQSLTHWLQVSPHSIFHK